ncbi:hypothetical protein GO013_00375 [Pseudodesulfovibrio sp. JC047]|uniref:tetratricopeptide repeat protein n=1 Tax=Pseudodesulfovibrio sp. JC047 TaxID=2683199 RepID=UPI0013D739B1|nr:tetratricopeptide repeat protein [Pseudodesulfovibrio sp. JC047]NDV17872.1 hypothetical protein [Pseudodesulfovibrio sp. JC047]
MKKVMFAVAMVSMLFMVAACGAQKNELDDGYALVKQGDCAGAQPYLDATIADPEQLMDLAYAYFLKGQCAEKAGDFEAAYKNFYGAKVVTCYAVNEEIHVNFNTYGRSEFCERIIPEKLAKLHKQIGNDQTVEAIINTMDEVLNARYLQRFQKRLD